MPGAEVATSQYVNHPQAAQSGDEGSELSKLVASHHHKRECLTVSVFKTSDLFDFPGGITSISHYSIYCIEQFHSVDNPPEDLRTVRGKAQSVYGAVAYYLET